MMNIVYILFGPWS